MNTPRQPFNIAATFADPGQAERVYLELERTLKALRFDAHVSRVMVKNQMYVSFLHEGDESSIPAPVMQAVRRILGKGQLTKLPPEAIANIQARRAERRARGVGAYESHTPTVSSYKYPAIRDVETKEILAEYPDQGELTGERPYTGPMPAPGSPVYSAELSDLPEDLRDQAVKMQEEIRRKQQTSRSATPKAPGIPTPPPGPAKADQARKPAPGKAGKPLVERYLTYLRVGQENALARIKAGTRMMPGTYEFNVAMARAYSDIYTRMAEQSLKYRLAASAQAMIEALRPRPLLRDDMTFAILAAIGDHSRELDPDLETPILHLPDAPIWLELEQPIATNAGEIYGMFFTCADREIERELAKPQPRAMQEALKAAGKGEGENYRWTLHFIDRDGTPASHYYYNESGQYWEIIPDSVPCPTDECIIDEEVNDATGRRYKHITPCHFCATILAYWRSWFITALLAVQGEYAATEYESQWPTRREQTTRKVKRPNSAKYDEIKVTHDYYLVSFDASVKRIREARPQEQEREPQERGSWVAAALEIDSESVVYVRHDFATTQRRLDPEHNPRWKAKRTVEVRAHSKRIPMKVNNLQRRITRVVASKYQDQATEPGPKPAPGSAANAQD
jgi:hypothetical protein